MTSLIIPPPFKVWPDVDGEPLEDGFVYIGLAGFNPESNPITVYFDSGLTIPAAQPLRTLGGFISNSGTPANIYSSYGQVSITVRNKNGTLVYTNLNVSVNEFSTFELDSVDDLANSRGLSSYGEVGIRSYRGGWQVTNDGPKGAHRAHTTGATATNPTVPPAVTAGTIGTGAQAGFYWDLDGNEWELSYINGVSPEMFGSYWDEITDSSLAFANMSEYIERLGGGRINLSPITYIVGEQSTDPSAGTNYYSPPQMLDIRNCTNPVVIAGNGAVMKIKDGQAYGGFDPVTGLSSADVSGNSIYAASLGNMIYLQDNASVTVQDVELDGNVANTNLGGTWGPAGRQIVSYGLTLRGNGNATVRDVYTHHHCLDGLLLQMPGSVETDPSQPVLLHNVKSEYNARQGLSLVGCLGITAINCDFNHTGRAVFQTSPGAGLDIEAEGAVNRNGVFINCRMIDNGGRGMVADSGDSADMTFRDCTFIGTTNSSIWPRKPRFTFENCKIVGQAINLFQDTDERNGTKFKGCTFTDDVNESPTGVVYNPGYLLTADQTVGTIGVELDGCFFNATQNKLAFFRRVTVVKNCVFNQVAGAGILPNRDFILFFSDLIIENNVINDQLTTPEADPYYISIDTATERRGFNYVVSPGNDIYWVTWSAGGGGYAGDIGRIDAPLFRRVRIQRRLRNDAFYGTRDIYNNNVAPTGGTYNQGDVVFNEAPTAGGKVGWVCVTAGSPGTWKPFGAIDP